MHTVQKVQEHAFGEDSERCSCSWKNAPRSTSARCVSADAAGSRKAAEAEISDLREAGRRSVSNEDVVQSAGRAHLLRRLPLQRLCRTMAVSRCCRALSGSSELFASELNLNV